MGEATEWAEGSFGGDAREGARGAGEALNVLTHGVGLLLSIPACVVLLVVAAGSEEPARLASGAVFGGALVLMYAASVLCHAFSGHHRLGLVLRVLDHVAIYALIAGTYTPFLVVGVGGSLGRALLLLVWALALAGTAFKCFSAGRFGAVSTGFYLFMGWLAVLFARPLFAALPPEGIALIVAGGLCYTAGVVFFACERIPHHHAIWHLFVLGGSAFHYAAVWTLLGR